MQNNVLFSSESFQNLADSRKEVLFAEIRNYDMPSILSMPLDEISSYFLDKYSFQPPQLKTEEIHLQESPRTVASTERVRDVGWGDGYDDYFNVTRNYIKFTVILPFEGDSSLFRCRPTSYQFNYSREMNASIEGEEIYLKYDEPIENENVDVNVLYEQDVNLIRENLRRLAHDIEIYNQNLPRLIQQKLAERKQVAEKNTAMIQSFKIPIRKRDDVPTTYAIPEVRKKASIIERPPTKAFTPEPTLAVEEYENILTILKDMSLAMERSPYTFASLKEPDIRNFFLILLNGHYQGNATGETFNGNGKTDILIRYHNANAFIAECKFWESPKKMSQAIDQLLGYVTWRDTKTAIVLFTKNPNLSSILEKANEAIRQHDNFKEEYELNSPSLRRNETIFAYKFTHPADAEKEIFLTLLAFQISTKVTTK